ncbi:MAG: phosphatase PAP2 family protein [Pseudolabrys sp.]
MTVINELKPQSGGASLLIVRRLAVTIAASLAMLVRAPRIHPLHSWLWPLRKLGIAIAISTVVFLLGMTFIDAPAIVYARTLPRPVISFFDWITDFGKSGWFLWPLGLVFMALAALPRLTPMSQRVLSAMMVRLGYLFAAIALPGIATNIIKHVIGRARPFVPGFADPTVFSPFSWSAAYASMPSGHSTTALSVLVAFGILWPRARAVLLIYAALICISRVVGDCASPDRRSGRRRDGRGGGAAGGPVFRPAPPGLFGAARRHIAGFSGSLGPAHQICCPRAFGLIRNGANAVSPRRDLINGYQRTGGLRRGAGAQRGRQYCSPGGRDCQGARRPMALRDRLRQ